jgi:hypothetical protein
MKKFGATEIKMKDNRNDTKSRLEEIIRAHKKDLGIKTASEPTSALERFTSSRLTARMEKKR